MTTAQVVFAATPVQDKLWHAVESPDLRIIGFGGGIRGTKTWGTLATLIALCRIYPGSRWHVIRKDLERLKDSTIPSFEKLALRFGSFIGKLNRQDWFVRCANGSEIHFIGENIDRDRELERLHGFETNGFLLEEADELSERTAVKCQERAGTWICPNGPQPPAFIFATFNPCASWPRRWFYLPWQARTIRPPFAFIPTTAADNPYVSDEQRAAWKHMPDLEYRRFVGGDWAALSGAYYDALSPAVLIDRTQLPAELPAYWHYWASCDWGYAHWAVMCFWATDTDGTDYLLDTVWLRKLQDAELATEFKKSPHIPAACFAQVYAGHDCWAKMKAREASGRTTAEVFAEHDILLVRAHIDKVNGGRAVNGQLKAARVKIVRTAGNLRVYDQLGEILPDDLDVRKPQKVDANADGVGGDDGADCFRYGIASRHAAGILPKRDERKEANVAAPNAGRIKDGKLQPLPPPVKTMADLIDQQRAKRTQFRTPPQQRSAKW